MVETIRTVFERYGFEPVETPAIEYTDALGKFLPDQGPAENEGVFSFQDDDEQWLSLRYDLTAPLARYVAENFQNLPMPYRSYTATAMCTATRSRARGRFPPVHAVRRRHGRRAPTMRPLTTPRCAAAGGEDTMEALGIKRGQYVVKVNNRKVLDGVMNTIGIPAEKQLTVLRTVDKLDRLGIDAVRQLLGPGRKDDSGDFTKGAGLDPLQIEYISAVIQHQPTLAVGNSKELDTWNKNLEENETAKAGRAEMNEIEKLILAAGYEDRVRIDPTVIRGLEYYTGPVFEVELLLETNDEKGRPVRFGSVGGGGRYDGLVSRFRGEPVPATGFSIGVSRLQAALTALGKLNSKPSAGPVLVTVFGAENVQASQKLAALRNAGIRAELYLGNPKHSVGQQLKYADKRGSPCAVIQGPDEKAKGEVHLRDLIAGSAPSNLKDRDEYLKKQAEAQVAVKESELVDAVRKLLARHKLG